MQNPTPILSRLAVDLVVKAQEGKFDPVIGRAQEIDHLIQILCSDSNNAVLIGERGVGKTAVVEGLAHRIISGTVPDVLSHMHLWQLEPSGFLYVSPGFQWKQMEIVQDRLTALLQELAVPGHIVFFDQLELTQAFGDELRQQFETLMNWGLTRTGLPCIAEISHQAFNEWQKANPTLVQRFQPIYVAEPSIEEAVRMLQLIKGLYEAHHQLVITDEAVQVAVKLSSQYLPERFLPVKALDLIDEASANLRLAKRPLGMRLRRVEAELVAISEELEKLGAEMTEVQRNERQKRYGQLTAELPVIQAGVANEPRELFVQSADIVEVLERWLGYPLS